MKTVYLCGPITGLSYQEATDWRTVFAGMLTGEIVALSPMRAKKYLEGETSLGFDYSKTLMSSNRAITARDRYDSTRCDILVSNLLGAKRVSIGSMIELGWADANRIPIILIMEPGNVHEHGMVHELASWIVGSFQEAAAVANAILTPGL